MESSQKPETRTFGNGPADERIIVRDDQFPAAEGTTVEMTLERALEMISKRFLIPGSDQTR